MYSTCLFCHARLGSNQTLERFRVGRRIAFDGVKGRLWVICPRCSRWNLAPLEERWEVQEECEERFRKAALRHSTDQIALARAEDGLELIRIGKPERPEMMVWRYGRRFRRRPLKQGMLTLGLATVGLAALSSPVFLTLGAAGVGAYGVANVYSLYTHTLRPVVAVPVGGGGTAGVTGFQIWQARLHRVRWDWALEIRARMGYGRISPGEAVTLTLRDETAIAASAALLPPMNPLFSRRKTIDAALDFLNGTHGVDDSFRAASRLGDGVRDSPAILGRLPAPVRLALEIAAHEEIERKAMEGDLSRLEAAWQEAEGIAVIADRLLVPDSIEEKIRRFRQEGTDLAE